MNIVKAAGTSAFGGLVWLHKAVSLDFGDYNHESWALSSLKG